MLIIIPFIQLFTRQMSDEERAREGGGSGYCNVLYLVENQA